MIMNGEPSSQVDLHNGVNHNGEETSMASDGSIIGNNDLTNGNVEIVIFGSEARPHWNKEMAI